jgi:hypothetical protein
MKSRLFGFLFGFITSISMAADLWLPVKDVSLMVEPGSILDFSSLLPVRKIITNRIVINSEGHFAFADQPKRAQRFLMATLSTDVATGSFPSHSMADLYVQQLRMHGYNMVRLHYVEATLMRNRQNDFDFDPEQMDRFHYLLSALKREGIYFVLDGLSSGNGAYGNIKERWVDERKLKLGVYYDLKAQAHWKRLIDKMLVTTNKYTSMSTLADPALAGLIMVNESGLAFMTRNGAPEEFRPLFTDWLKKKHGSTASLATAWKGELRAGESIEANSISLPKIDAWTSPRMADTQEFFVDLEKTTADWMTLYLRQLGYKGLLTAYDNWISPAAHLSRAQFDWVDLHNYYFEPSKFTASGSVMRQESMLAGGAKYIVELAAGKHISKVFSVSEYGQVFWNKYRRESALAVPAYASFQNWDMISQHTGALILSYAELGGRKDKIFPFMVGPDPIARANETLAAILFLRGDVATAKRTFALDLKPNFAFKENPFYGNMPIDISRLALLSGLALDTQSGASAIVNYDGLLSPGDIGIKTAGKRAMSPPASEQSTLAKVDALAGEYAGNFASKIKNTQMLAEDRLARRVALFRKSGFLDVKNTTDIDKGIYQADTGQLQLSTKKRQLTVVTPKTEAVVFDVLEPITLNKLKIETADGPAMLAVSSMDGQPLHTSKRMLIILATDARNSAMRFSDTAETTLLDLGKSPVLIQARRITLSLKNKHAAQLKIYSNTLGGARGDLIPVKQETDGISFVLDTGKLSHGPTTYFEITDHE